MAHHALRLALTSPAAGLAALLAFGCWAYDARIQAQQHDGHPLGLVDFRISCSQQAQVEFNRAIALLHHMTYPQAREAFQRAAAVDPTCAMAQWGVAMTL